MITITATQSRSHVTRRIVSQNQNLEVNNKEGRVSTASYYIELVRFLVGVIHGGSGIL